MLPLFASSIGEFKLFCRAGDDGPAFLKSVDKRRSLCYYSEALREIPSESEYGRVVELVDSLDSGSSVHCGRAGSSPASPTKNKGHPQGCLFLVVKEYHRLCRCVQKSSTYA